MPELCLLAHYGARKFLFTGLVECGEVIFYFFFSEQRQEASTPFTQQHREIGQNDTQKYGKQVGGDTFGVTLSIETRNASVVGVDSVDIYMHNVVYTAGPSQAIHLVVQSNVLTRPFICNAACRACVWRERVCVCMGGRRCLA